MRASTPINNDRKPQWGSLTRRPSGNPEWLSDCLLARSGRDAIASLIRKSAEWTEVRTVALPAYCAEGLISGFRSQGVGTVFYALNQNLGVNTDDLAELLGRTHCDALVLMHPLGAPLSHPVDHGGMLVLEDRSHFLPIDTSSGRPLVAERDRWTLVSLPKLIGVPDGGIIVPPKGETLISTNDSEDWRYLIRRCVELSGPGGRLTNKIVDPYRRIRATTGEPFGMSRLSRELLWRTDLAQIALQRTANWNRLFDEITPSISRAADTRLDQAAIPFGFPLLVDDGTKTAQNLAAHGIRAVRLANRWDLAANSRLSTAAKESLHACLTQHLILPTNERLTSEQVKRMIEAINEAEI